MATNNIYYPPLSSVVKINQLPEELSFIQGAIDSILGKILVKEYVSSKNAYGDTITINTTLRTYNLLSFEIPGTGLILTLNPASEADVSGVSELIVIINVKNELFRILNKKDLSNFSFSPDAIFSLILKTLGISIADLYKLVLNNFTFDTRIETLTNEINTFYNLIPLLVATNSGNIDTDIETLVNDINSHEQLIEVEKGAEEVILEVFINNIDIEDDTPIEQRINALFSSLMGTSPIERLKNMLKLKFDITFDNLGVGIEFPNKILKPVDENNVPIEGKVSSLIFQAGVFYFNTEDGFGYKGDVTASLNSRSEILNTGFIIDFDGAKADFSRTKNIAEATADGRPDDFVGVFVETAEIGLPAKWFKSLDGGAPPTIFGRNLIIGTGGLSGTIGFDAEKSINLKMGDFEITLNSFDVVFQQNSIIKSDISGSLKIKNFKQKKQDGSTELTDATIQINLSFDADGNFKITAKEDQGKINIIIPDVLEISLSSVSVGKQDDLYFLDISGNMKIINENLSNVFKAAIDVKGLIIWSDGKIEIKGGGLQLPKAISIKLGAADISITAIHYGSHEQSKSGVMRKYNYFGFDGGVNINPGGVDAKGSGIKFYFTVDDGDFDCFLRLESISIDLIIPGTAKPKDATALINGFLSIKGPTTENPNAAEEYAGGVSIELPKAGISATASMRMAPKIPAFIIDLGLELPTPIPLGPTGLGIYGFRGLLGQRYVASQETTKTTTWWEYYKAKIAPDNKEGIQVSKFAQEPGFSVGAGLSLATAVDSGKAFSSKLFIMLSPGIFLLQGQAQILKKRLGLETTNDPPFSLLIAITDESVLADFNINFKLPVDGGEILTLNAHTEMGFFFHDSGAWYVNIGTELNKNTARVFSLFDMNSYLMISAAGIKAGASVNMKKEKKVLMVYGKLEIYASIDGKINFVPAQIGATIMLGGSLDISVWGLGIGLTVDTTVAAEINHPFYINGEIKGCLSRRNKKKESKKCISFDFKWVRDSSPNTFEIPLHISGTGAAACNIATNEIFKLKAITEFNSNTALSIADDYIIPLDSIIKFEFLKPVASSEKLRNKIYFVSGSGNTDRVPQVKGKLAQIGHTFTVDDVLIKFWDGAEWKDYDMYAELYPTDKDIIVTRPSGNYIGSWQLDKSGKKVTQLWILGTDPFEWTRQGNQIPDLSSFDITSSDLFCRSVLDLKQCLIFDDFEDITIPAGIEKFNKASYKLIIKNGIVQTFTNPFGHNKGLSVQSGGRIEILFTEPVANVNLQLHSTSLNTKIRYYKKVEIELDEEGFPIYGFTLIEEISYKLEDTVNPIAYTSETSAVDKIEIEAKSCGSSTTQDDPCAPKQEIICSDLKVEVSDFRILLNKLIERGQLTNTNKLSVKLTETPYIDFYSRILKGYLSSPVGSIHYYYSESIIPLTLSGIIKSIVTKPDGTLDPKPGIRGVSELKFSLSFTSYDTIYSFNDIVSFEDIQVKTEGLKPGEVHDFYITAVMTDGSRQILKATSDYVIATCTNNLAVTPDVQTNAFESKKEEIQSKIDSLTIKIEQYNEMKSPCSIMISELNKELAELNFNLAALEGITTLPTPPEGSEQWCGVILFGCCWITTTDYAIIQNLPSQFDIMANNQSMIEAINNSYRPIWKPGTDYIIQIQATDTVKYISGNNSYPPIIPTPKVFNYAFRTAGPVGHFHKLSGTDYHPLYQKLLDDNREDEFKLAKLQNYIDFTRSYPNADGNILNAKPLFYRDPEMLLVFSQPHAYTMFEVFDNTELKIRIKDPVLPDAGEIDLAHITWEVNSFVKPGANNVVLNNFIDYGATCSKVTNALPIGSQIKYTVSYLKPLKLYTAVFISIYKNNEEKVHSFPFQTSRYACFREQVESYMTVEGNYMPCVICTDEPSTDYVVKAKAFFDFVKYFDTTELQQDLVNAKSLVQNTLSDDELITQFPNKFDRLLNGVLKIEELPPALNTEFNIIVDGNTNKALGILVRNPEPFNDPKIPIDILEKTIQVVNSNSETAEVIAGFRVIFSKDLTKAFITNDNLEITETQLFLRFKYYEYIVKDGIYDVKCPINNIVFVQVDVKTPQSKLSDLYCNKQEIALDSFVEAKQIDGASAYEFKITKSDFEYIYKRNSTDAKCPIYEIPGIEYNKTYNVQVRPIISGRISTFGDSCTVGTKTLMFVIKSASIGITDVPLNITIEARDLNGNGKIVRDYNGAITLETIGSSATGGGLVQIVGGIVNVLINDSVAETITLSLNDTENTGINLGANKSILFEEPKPIGIIIEPIAQAVQGSPLQVFFRVKMNNGLLSETYSESINILLTGNATGAGTINFVNGIASITINNDEVETTELSIDATSTNLKIPEKVLITFIPQPATKFVIIDPSDVPEETYAEVVIEARNSYANVDLSYNKAITLIATASESGLLSLPNNGLVNFINGVGKILIYSDIPQKVVLTLEDTQNTGLDFSSAIQEMFFVVVKGIGFEDSFTELEGATLANHIPDVGYRWVKFSEVNLATLKVNSLEDTLVPGTGTVDCGVLYLAEMEYDYPGADYQVEALILNNGNDTNPIYLVARVIDIDNMYAVRISKEGTKLYKKTEGNWYLLAETGAILVGSVVKLSVMGNKLIVYNDFNDVMLSFIDSDILVAGKAGIGMGALIDPNDGLGAQVVDSFIIRFGSDLDMIFLDKFLTNNLLENNIPDMGLSWNKIITLGGSLGITSKNGVAEPTTIKKKVKNLGSFYLANVEYSKADYEVSLIVRKGENKIFTTILGVRVSSDALNGYFVRFNNDLCILYKRVAGEWTSIVSSSGVPNGARVRLRIVNDKLDFIINSKIELTATVSEINEIGKAGFGFGAVIELLDDEKNQQIDDFIVRII